MNNKAWLSHPVKTDLLCGFEPVDKTEDVFSASSGVRFEGSSRNDIYEVVLNTKKLWQFSLIVMVQNIRPIPIVKNGYLQVFLEKKTIQKHNTGWNKK